jgi:hypothetical protein
MITEINLDWSRPLLMKDRIGLLAGRSAGGFYMFLCGKGPPPLYIGQAFFSL